MDRMSHTLSIENVSKHYGTVAALDDVSLQVKRGQFLTLLGPSGSGKTTLLMAIAGFVAPDAGRINLDGQPIDHLPPEKRNFGMVFQGYALFPHLSVFENVAFPLRVRGSRGPRSTRRSARRSISCSSAVLPSGCRTSFRAASSSAPRWRARSSSSRASCCSTSL